MQGTIGQSVWRSTDSGDTWNRASNGIFPEADVRAIAVNPNNADVVYAGTDKGVFRSENGGDAWQALPSEMDALEVWALAIDTTAPRDALRGHLSLRLFQIHRRWRILAETER